MVQDFLSTYRRATRNYNLEYLIFRLDVLILLLQIVVYRISFYDAFEIKIQNEVFRTRVNSP